MTTVRHLGCHSVNCNYNVFLPYLENFFNFALMMVCHKYGCVRRICDTLLLKPYKHTAGFVV